MAAKRSTTAKNAKTKFGGRKIAVERNPDGEPIGDHGLPHDDVVKRLSGAIRTYYAGDSRSPDAMSDEEYEELVGSSSLTPNEVDAIKRSSILLTDRIRHKHPMTSLDKIHSLDDARRMRGGTRVYQKKFDGCSLEVHYDHDGDMDYACTRGDYTYGENRTNLAKVMVDRGRIHGHDPDLADSSLRGELLVPDDSWAVIDHEFSNQRNAASGIANRKDFVYVDYLVFVPYDVVRDDGSKELYQGQGHADIYDSFEAVRDSIKDSPVTTDGIVIKDFADDTLKDQRYAVAYKFSDREYETTLRNVRWQLGKTGKLTPIAEFDTVFIDAEVSKASLGSLSVFRTLDLHYGDRVTVRKANAVIPHVTGNKGGGIQPISYPRYWNGSETWVEGNHLFTVNPSRWKDILYSQVDNLTGKGISRKFVDTIFDEYGVTTLTELYDVVNRDEFTIPGFGEKKVALARKCLDDLKTVGLSDFISALSIDGMQRRTVEKLLSKVSMDAQERNVSQYNILLHLDDPMGYAGQIKDIGEVTARNFERAYPMLREQLNDYSVTFGHYPAEYDTLVRNDGPEVVITGSFDGMHRRDVRDILIKNGYNVATKVSSNTGLVIAGEGGGRKREAARSLGVEVVETSGDFSKGAQRVEDKFKNGKIVSK